MHEEIVDYIGSRPDGVTSKELAECFLKFKNPPESVASAALQGLLSQDSRCYQDVKKLWHCTKATNASGQKFSEMGVKAVYILNDQNRKTGPLYVAVWSILPEPKYELGFWLVDPSMLSFEERELLVSGIDELWESSEVNERVENTAYLINQGLPVFASYHDYNLLANYFLSIGELLTDDVLLAGELIRAAAIPMKRKITLSAVSEAVLENSTIPVSAFRQSERFAECVFETIEMLKKRGVLSREDVDKCNEVNYQNIFKGKKFSYDDITKLPGTPGVYGFKDKEGKIIYVGKSKNLKRRMMSYFRTVDESPEKICFIQNNADAFVTYNCGSELECIIYEHRLIGKYTPCLNKQFDIRERQGDYRPINDCIILLPHSLPEKCMSFWFRRDQKLILKPLNLAWSTNESVLEEIKEFFFKEKLPVDNQDFPELEIATRWIKKNEVKITIVPVNRYSSAEEIYDAVKSYWKDFSEKEDKNR